MSVIFLKTIRTHLKINRSNNNKKCLATAGISARLRLGGQAHHILICFAPHAFVSRERKCPRYAIYFEMGSSIQLLAIQIRPYRLTARTEPSQGSNPGSIPGGVKKF